MCEYCGQLPHNSRCPNWIPSFTDKKGRCKHCHDYILTEEEYVDVNKGLYHIDCLENLTIKELLAIFEISIQNG